MQGKCQELKGIDFQTERIYQRPTTVKTSKDQHKDTSSKHFLKVHSEVRKLEGHYTSQQKPKKLEENKAIQNSEIKAIFKLVFCTQLDSF